MGKRIDNREFVVTWMNSETTEDVAKTFGVSIASASAKAHNLRKQGVALPKKNGRKTATGKQLEIAQLNSLIKKHSK